MTVQTLFPDLVQERVADALEFRALSLWQPHAQAIALGIKTYETRSWSTSYRGPLVVHAAQKKFQHKDYPDSYFQEACVRLRLAGCPYQGLRYGEALCLVDLVDCVPTERLESLSIGTRFWGDFGPGRFAFRLENVRKVWPPVRATGRQGFFRIELPVGNEALKGGGA